MAHEIWKYSKSSINKVDRSLELAGFNETTCKDTVYCRLIDVNKSLILLECFWSQKYYQTSKDQNY